MSDHDLSLFALYLIPTLYAAWFLGIRWGYVSCLASAAVWGIEDWGGAVFYHHALIPYWNVAGRLIVLTVIVAVVNALKQSLEVEHEYEAERRGTQRELEIAREVQKRLLPSLAPEYPRSTSLSSTSRPVKWVATTMISFRSAQNRWVLPSGMFAAKDSPALC